MRGLVPVHQRSSVHCALAVVALLVPAALAHAGGLEYAGGQGAQALGRGGAVTARADDPMVLAFNPAGLAELRGTQFLFDLNLALMDACVDPAGYYGWGAYDGGQPSRITDPDTGETASLQLGVAPVGAAEQRYYDDPLDTVCLKQTVTPVPQIGWTKRVSEELGIGVGLIFPGVQPQGSWGGENGVIRGDDGELRLAPTRYMLLRSNNIGAFPTVGAGYRISDMLRFGLALEWGMIGVNNFTMSARGGGTSPARDIVAHVQGQDWFVPAFTVSTHVVPADPLDIVLAFRFQDDLEAQGNVDLTTGLFDQASTPRTTNDLKIVAIRQHFPWKLRAGVRYADRLAPRPRGTGADEADPANPDVLHDPLQDERWDAELDVEYQLNSRNDKQVLDYRVGQNIEFEDTAGNVSLVPYPNEVVPNTEIEKSWKNQLSVRLGGTFNALPGVVGVMAGAHYENRGVNPDYMQIDYWPVERVGLHTGVVLRVAKSIDIVLSYAHIFQETVVVAPPPHAPRQITFETFDTTRRLEAIDKTVGTPIDRAGTGTQVKEAPPQGSPDGVARLDQNLSRTGAGEPPWITNAGRYRSNFDVLAAGLTLHF